MQNTLTFEEQELMAIYNATGTRQGLIDSLSEMRTSLGSNEDELLKLTDSSLEKLKAMTDEEYEALDLSSFL